MNKKLLMALVCSVLLMGLAACGSSDKASNQKNQNKKLKKKMNKRN